MDIVLDNGEIVCIDGDARDLAVLCHSGRLWITQPGDLTDYMLIPGERFIVTRKGKITITAFDNSRVKFTEPVGIGQAASRWQVMTA